MWRAMQCGALVLLMAGSAAAVDVTLRDGTVISATSYRLTGSYIMLEMADGRHVAYDVADVDLDVLRAAEAANAPEPEPAEETGGKLSSGRSLKDASTVGDDDSSSPKITDRDVRHIRGSGVVGDEEGEEGDTNADGGIPEGYQQGGAVGLSSINVSPAGEGRWNIEGTVINRSPQTVNNVRVRFEAAIAGAEEPWKGEVPVTGTLPPDETGSFSHSFAGDAPEGRAHPDVRTSVIWTRVETRRELDTRRSQNWGGGQVPAGSERVQVGGVTGADARPTPVIDD